MLPDIDAVARIIQDVAAEEIMPRFQHLAAGDIREKGPGDLVTVADEASERALSRQLTELLPGSTVVGEEAYAEDRSVLARLAGQEPVWIIDPVDGTHNFASGKPVFGVIVALAQGGRTRAGWIHDPNQDRTLVAVEGEGAWMGGTRLAVSPAGSLAQMHGALASKFFDPETREHLELKRPTFAGTYNMFCAAHEYLRLAGGGGHFALYQRLMPWDHAAGVLAHREAGGYSAKLDGSPYRPTDTEGGILLAPDAGSWKDLRQILFGR